MLMPFRNSTYLSLTLGPVTKQKPYTLDGSAKQKPGKGLTHSPEPNLDLYQLSIVCPSYQMQLTSGP